MRYIQRLSLLLLVLVFGFASVREAGAVDKKKKGQNTEAPAAKSAAVGDCSPGAAFDFLDVNNVRAKLFNTGALFWKGNPAVYTVPKSGKAEAIFASGIWLGGMSNGKLRMAASDYGPYEFWPGPLDNQGNAPADCSIYDRIYKVSREDIVKLENTGEAERDIREWPWELGAPVVDGDGNPNNYNLAGGDRPELLGDQMAWWVMNDMGNTHDWSNALPIGLEVQVTAFAFNTSGALGNTTFYKYKLINKGQNTLTDAWFGIWSDPDLGDAGDDYVGSDTTRGIGFVYNGKSPDADYGEPVPALGYDFFQGPLVPKAGSTWTDPDGTVHQNATRLGMRKFVYYNNAPTVVGDPQNGQEAYQYLKGQWRDGKTITLGGDGRNFSQIPVDFMFPGDPSTRAFWSEENTDGAGNRNQPSDRRFVMSAGAFTLNPGDVQDIVYGIVWSRGTDRLNSVVKMKQDDELAQSVFNINFKLPAPPAAPDIAVTELDQKAIMTWSYKPTANNFLASYTATNPLLSTDISDRLYRFEGFKVYQFSSPSDTKGKVIATYDKVNGITRIIEGEGLTFITADGTDSGLKYQIVFDNLTNYQDYYYGVSAYAYNVNSSPKVYEGPVNRVTITPGKAEARGTTIVESGLGKSFSLGQGVTSKQVGQGALEATIIDPGQVTGGKYKVEFKKITKKDATDHDVNFTVYDIVNVTSGTKLFDGEAFFNRQCNKSGAFKLSDCKEPPLGPNVFHAEGVSFSILGADPGFLDFQAVANAAGPINPPTPAAACYQGFPCTFSDPNHAEVPGDNQQVGGAKFFIHTGGQRATYDQFFSRTTRDGGNFAEIGPYDYEMRFTGTSKAAKQGIFAQGPPEFVEVPFELWNIGIGTPNDKSDDYRMIPIILEESAATEDGRWDFYGDHPSSGALNDPYTDWIYWYNPVNHAPGQAGYNAYATSPLNYDAIGGEVFARTVLVMWNGGLAKPYKQPRPEDGTIFRIITAKPNQPGDTFEFSTEGLGVQALAAEDAEKALDLIGIVPNPYKGASAYETDNINDVARFINMPSEATIRIFSLNGTLIRTLNKASSQQYLEWDLKTQAGLDIASGMYLIHIEVPNVGERVLKFGVVKKRIQLDLL